MPAETTKRRQKVFTEEELKDIEQKRIRGELSCAECRRLKLRCDKQVPCSSCCRRGCESICPCGILSAGQGTRFILADTDRLHQKISEMSTRIRQLEDALAILQANVTNERHPLLHDELLTIKFGIEKESPGTSRPANTHTIDALGTLTFTDSGDTRYFGLTAGSETLMAGEEWDDISDTEENIDMAGMSDEPHANFPFSINSVSLSGLIERLPPQDRACYLSQSYLDHASFFFRPIKSQELFESFLPKAYNDPSSLPGESLAMLFFILALGALLDLQISAYNKEAELYYRLGVRAISSRPLLDAPQFDSVRAVGLMATYHSMASKQYSRDSAWCCMSLAAKLAQSIGLHRDSARWHMDPTVVQQRRTLWWEILTSDVSHSLAIGRPPSIHQSFADCEFPTDEEATLSNSGEVEYGFWRMKYTFARDIFIPVVDATLAAKPPSYTTVLDLDKKVRQTLFPSSLRPNAGREDGEANYCSSSRSLRDFYASQHRTVTMLYLHRSYFAQSILDHPENPLLSPFAPSFLTAFRSASIVIKAAAHQIDRCAEMATRVWFLLYHIFSSAIIVGSVVTRSPTSNIAPGALLDLELAVKLFEKSSVHSGRARIALGLLRKLKDKATRSFSQRTTRLSPEINLTDGQEHESDDELAIFGGQRKVLTKPRRSKNKSQSGHSPASSLSNASTSPVNVMKDLSPITVHPSLVDFLKDGDARHVPFTSPLSGGSSAAWHQQGQLSTHNAPDYTEAYDNVLFERNNEGEIHWAPSVPQGYGPPSTVQTPDPLAEWASSSSYNPIAPYPDPSMLFNGGTTGQADVDSSSMFELGLMTESEMDAGWMSFMRECGVLPGVGASS